MSVEKPHKRLLKIFAGELDEQVATIRREVMRLKELPEEERVGEVAPLFRAVHSLKGAARAVDIDKIERYCHDLEDLLDDVRHGRREASAQILAECLSAADHLAEAGARLARQEDVGDLPEAPFSSVSKPSSTSEISKPSPQPVADGASVQAPPQPASLSTPPAPSTRRASIRMPVDALDDLVHRTRGLLTESRQLHSRTKSGIVGAEQTGSSMALDERLRQVCQSVESINHDLLRIRMQPLSVAFTPLETVLAEFVAGKDDRRVELKFHGAHIGVDHEVLQSLSTILRHLVLNAAAHGIEPPRERSEAGKEPIGSIDVIARHDGDRLVVIVGDDGRGIDWESVARRAEALGLSDTEDRAALIRHLFYPGLTTTSGVTAVSGRGVGLDIVSDEIDHIGGHIDVESTPTKGTRFIISAPVTMSSVDALIVSCRQQQFAIPTGHIEGMYLVESRELDTIDGEPSLITEDGPVRLVHLSDIVGSGIAQRRSERRRIVIIRAGFRHLALVVDGWSAVEPLVVQRLGPRLQGLAIYSGTSTLDDGRLVLILRVGEIFQIINKNSASSPAAEHDARLPSVLIVDDSITTRTLFETILGGAGYRVTAAADGQQALDILERIDVDVVVADVEMPLVDGLELTRKIRAHRKLSYLPVILVTARASAEDQQRGLEAGADAYHIKNMMDAAELIAALETLV